MAAKTYRFPHALGRDAAIRRLEPAIAQIAGQYGLGRSDAPDGSLALRRTGVDAQVRVGETEVEVAVELNWFLEKTVRERIEDALHKDFAPLLRG
jgi:putative polyhydroxyalkanoate system protein